MTFQVWISHEWIREAICDIGNFIVSWDASNYKEQTSNWPYKNNSVSFLTQQVQAVGQVGSVHLSSVIPR